MKMFGKCVIISNNIIIENEEYNRVLNNIKCKNFI